MKNLLLVLRFRALSLISGMVLLAGGVYGLATYAPLPADYLFEAPPYNYAFWVFVVLGAYLVLQAWFKGIQGERE